MGTRPGVNLMLATLDRPAGPRSASSRSTSRKRSKPLKRAMRRLYRRLDALVVLTEGDLDRYGEMLKGRVPLYRIPNTVRPLPGAKADLGAKTVYAAGRFRDQKGFDLLIPAWAQVAPKHPDWRLRLRGDGHRRRMLEGLIEEHGLTAPCRWRARPRTSAPTWRGRRSSCSARASRASR